MSYCNIKSNILGNNNKNDIPYNGGAIKLILIGSSSVERAKPAFKAAFTASIPS